MALSLSNFLFAATLLLQPCIRFSQAAAVTYEYNITWVRANPDGELERSVMAINNQWPIPALRTTKGDRLVITTNNNLGNETTSLHWHGIFMSGTPHMDGPPGVSQCEIPPGGSFTYNFTVDQPGTYWFHSHTRGQYPDGLRAPLIVEDPDDPFKDQYDEQIVLSFSDWYHDLMKPLLAKFISVANPTGAEPVPNSALMNDAQNLTVSVEPGKTYMIRMVNMAAFAAMYFSIEGHTMRIVEVDGVYTEPAEADMLYITAAQRYSVLLTTKNDTNRNFAIVANMDQDLFDTIPDDGRKLNVTGWLVYDQQKELQDPAPVTEFNPFDDFALVPHDGQKLFDNVARSVTLDLKMDNLGDGANYAFLNDITYVAPKVPALYTVMSSGDTATNPLIYGSHTNSFVLNGNETIEIILNNNDPGKHPFHLHGHNLQLVTRSLEEAGFYDPNNTTALPSVPMRRDTILVRPNGHIVMRIRSDNPGVWLFHCHIEWHVASGLTATFVEAPLTLQKTLVIPEAHFSLCGANDPPTPTAGNAAGNTINLLSLSGEPAPPKSLPAGFTARGIVALVFSVISAFLGVAVVAWYGAQPMGKPNALGGGVVGNQDAAQNQNGGASASGSASDQAVGGNEASETRRRRVQEEE